MALVTAGRRRRPAGPVARTPARTPRHVRPAVQLARTPVGEAHVCPSTRTPTVETAPTTARAPANTARAVAHASNVPETAIVRAPRQGAISAPTPASGAWGAATARAAILSVTPAPTPAWNVLATATAPPLSRTVLITSVTNAPLTPSVRGRARLASPSSANAVSRARAMFLPTGGSIASMAGRVGCRMNPAAVPYPPRSTTWTLQPIVTIARARAHFVCPTTLLRVLDRLFSVLTWGEPGTTALDIVSKRRRPIPMAFNAGLRPFRTADAPQQTPPSLPSLSTVAPAPSPGRAQAVFTSLIRRLTPAVCASPASQVQRPTCGLTKST
jgi:hypothetical protein